MPAKHSKNHPRCETPFLRFFFLFSSSSFFSLFLLRLLLYRYDNFTKTINLVTLTIKKEEKKK